MCVKHSKYMGGGGGGCMVVRFITICAISAYHHLRCGFQSCSWRGVLDTTLGDNVLPVTCGRLVVFSGYSGFLQQ
jgi:hypothetical protein